MATMAIGKTGARNAAIFAAQILAVADPEMLEKLRKRRRKIASDMGKKARRLASARARTRRKQR